MQFSGNFKGKIPILSKFWAQGPPWGQNSAGPPDQNPGSAPGQIDWMCSHWGRTSYDCSPRKLYPSVLFLYNHRTHRQQKSQCEWITEENTTAKTLLRMMQDWQKFYQRCKKKTLSSAFVYKNCSGYKWLRWKSGQRQEALRMDKAKSAALINSRVFDSQVKEERKDDSKEWLVQHATHRLKSPCSDPRGAPVAWKTPPWHNGRSQKRWSGRLYWPRCQAFWQMSSKGMQKKKTRTHIQKAVISWTSQKLQKKWCTLATKYRASTFFSLEWFRISCRRCLCFASVCARGT